MTFLTSMFVAGMIGLIIGAITERIQRGTILEQCAQLKTAEKINGKFFYIVPEEKYIEMEANNAKRNSTTIG